MTYTERFSHALVAASELHRDQVRKGTTIPYVSHLLGTCTIAMEHGANEDQAIAALLHDVLEDVPGDAARARVAGFGAEVLRIVEACTDGLAGKKGAWRGRKEQYLDRLAHEDAAVLLVSASDKLHNARSLLADLQAVGPELWIRFTVKDPDQQLWYYRSLVAAYRGNPAHDAALVRELNESVEQIARLSGQAPRPSEG